MHASADNYIKFHILMLLDLPFLGDRYYKHTQGEKREWIKMIMDSFIGETKHVF